MTLIRLPQLRRLIRFVTGPLLSAAAVTLLCSTAAPLKGQMPSDRVRLATNTASSFAHALDGGAIPGSQRVTLTLSLAATPARSSALDQFLAGLTASSSPNFHRWLTPAQFAETYGATVGQLASAQAWAESQGLSVDSVSVAGTRMTISGSAAQIEAALAVTIHQFQINGRLYFGNVDEPSFPGQVAPLFSAIEGLDNFPTDLVSSTSPGASPATSVNGKAASLSVASLAALVDDNRTPVLALDATLFVAPTSSAQLAAYGALFRQAAAQGISLLVIQNPSLGDAFPADFPEVTAIALAGSGPEALVSSVARPAWQVAVGLPSDAVRHAPDLAAPSLAAFAQTIASIGGGNRLGNIAPTLYTLAPTPGLFTQPDASAAGTWEPATGLGLVDLDTLGKVFPRGTGTSFASFAATQYSPVHGQGTSFTSNVTSGTGGPVPTGTVSFVTSTGTTLGTVPLVSGSGSFSIKTLDGGNYTIGAVYSGDATYAPASSPTGQLYIQPEPSALSVAISGNPVFGGSYNVVVTDTASSGVGQPAGPVTVMISGTSSAYTATLMPSTPNSSVATIPITATNVGTLTLSTNCTGNVNFSCNNPFTSTVTIVKATPTLSISFSPNPPVSGANIILNAVVSGVGTAALPTGNVRFFDNTTILNASTLTNGTTTTTGTVPTTATHSITSTYDGDANYLAVSTSAGSTTSGTIATTTTLISSAATVTAGQTINFTAVVTPASAGPSPEGGAVQFFDGGTLLGTANVVSHVAVFPIATLASNANHVITAVYSGDVNYSASTSPPITVGKTINPIVTTTTLTASSATVVPGRAITFTATIAPASQTIPGPTGTVQFLDGSTLIGSASVSGNVATFSTATLSATASHSITAIYSGDTGYTASTSAAVIVGKTAALIPTTTLLTASSTTITPGAAITLIATVAPASAGAATPSGTVEFFDGATILGTAPVSNNAAEFATTTLSSTVSHSITAVYSGDTIYAASTSPIVVVGKNSATTATVTTLTVTPSAGVAGTTFSFSAVVTPTVNNVLPSGTMQFSYGGTVACTATLAGSTASCSVRNLPAGAVAIVASYLGDAKYAASVSAPTTVTVSTAASSLTATISPAVGTPGAAAVITATLVAPVGTVPTGTINAVILGVAGANYSVTLPGTPNTSTLTLTIPIVIPATAGSYNVVVSCTGTNFTCAPQTLTLVSGSSTGTPGVLTATIAPAAVAPGATATVTATVTAPAGTIPSGFVLVTIAGATTNLQIPNATTSNVVTLSIPISAPTTPGTYPVVVACSTAQLQCIPVTLSLVSSPTAPQTGMLAATLSASSAPPGSTVVVTATVTSPAGTVPTGTISATVGVNSGPIATYTAQLPATGITNTSTVTISILVPATQGAYNIAVTCTNTNFACVPVNLTLTSSVTPGKAPTMTVLTATPSTTVPGSTTLTATVTTLYAATSPVTGTIAFFDGTTQIGLVALPASGGVATTTVTLSANIAHSLTAVYSGDTNFATSTSAAISGTGTPIATAGITLSSNITSGLAGSSVVLTATVTGTTATGKSPTGTVSFYLAGTPALIGTATLGTAGAGIATAVLSTSNLPAGRLTIYAVYSGDLNFGTVTSASITVGLSDYGVTFIPQTLTLTAGQTGHVTALASIVNNFGGTIIFGCTPPPNMAITCSFAPATLVGGGSTSLTITTAAAQARVLPGQPDSGFGIAGGIGFAALVCWLWPGRRRRVPAMLLALFAVGLFMNMGCSKNDFFANKNIGAAGTPLGTTLLTITTAGTDGASSVRHNYTYQLTIQ